MYVYISEGSIIGTSDEPLPINAEVIETSIEGPVELIDGKIIAKINKTKLEIRSLLVSVKNLSLLDLEGITFSDQEIGDIIVDRCFGGNPHAQMALLAKMIGVIAKQGSGQALSEDDLLVLQKSEETRIAINEVRLKCSLSSL